MDQHFVVFKTGGDGIFIQSVDEVTFNDVVDVSEDWRWAYTLSTFDPLMDIQRPFQKFIKR